MVMAQKYPAKYDQVNIDNVLSNDRVLTNYIKCLLEKGACTREGRELKSKCLPLIYLPALSVVFVCFIFAFFMRNIFEQEFDISAKTRINEPVR